MLTMTRWHLWRLLGFGRCVGGWPEDDLPGMVFANGHLDISTVLVLGWRHRLRVLVSGKIMLEQAVKTDVLPKRSKVRSVWSVLPPGGTMVEGG